MKTSRIRIKTHPIPHRLKRQQPHGKQHLLLLPPRQPVAIGSGSVSDLPGVDSLAAAKTTGHELRPLATYN
jgi:hypothetical protein